MKVRNYTDLEVWQLGRLMAGKVYGTTSKLPDAEKFGLTSQLRRAAISIPSNIAEGWGRHYTAEFIQFLRKANGSRTEMETQLIVCSDIGYLSRKEVEVLLEQTTLIGKKTA